MINDLDATIVALLNDKLVPALPGIQISFAAPDDKFATQSGSPRVNFFLYDVRENMELRDCVPQRKHVSGGNAVRILPAPVRVDFSYIVTAWPSDSLIDSIEDEHRILGEVLAILVRHREMPQEYLRGTLSDQELPLPINSLHPGRLQSPGEFWQALGGKPKATLNYQITVAVARHSADYQPEAVPLVHEKRLALRIPKGKEE